MNLKHETIKAIEKLRVALVNENAILTHTASCDIRLGMELLMENHQEILALEGYHKTEWVSCEDRLPNTNDTVLTYTNYRRTVFTTYYFAKQWDTYHFNYEDETPTHWMPLPPAPNTKP